MTINDILEVVVKKRSEKFQYQVFNIVHLYHELKELGNNGEYISVKESNFKVSVIVDEIEETIFKLEPMIFKGTMKEYFIRLTWCYDPDENCNTILTARMVEPVRQPAHFWATKDKDGLIDGLHLIKDDKILSKLNILV